MNYFGSIFAMVVCIAMSAYFSATETAFSSLNKTRLKVLADNGNKRAALALKLSEDYDKLISTMILTILLPTRMVESSSSYRSARARVSAARFCPRSARLLRRARLRDE